MDRLLSPNEPASCRECSMSCKNKDLEKSLDYAVGFVHSSKGTARPSWYSSIYVKIVVAYILVLLGYYFLSGINMVRRRLESVRLHPSEGKLAPASSVTA